jgi:hypothetical protein
MVRKGVAALALTAGVLMAGCGTTHRSVSPAQLAAYARAVNLREGDVPGMSTRSEELETTAGTFAVALARCGNGLPGWDARSVRSLGFVADPSLRLEVVYSAVRAAPSPAVALRDVAANRTPVVRRCIASAFAATPQERGPLVRESIAVSPLPSTVPSAADSFGLMVTNRVTHLEANPRPPEHTPAEEANRIRTQHNIAWDIFGFASGRAEVALTVLYEPGHPPLQNERRLLSLLYSRAKAHRL